jgi:hypothetical protein
VADTLPSDTASSARAELTRPSADRYTPSAQEQARLAAAVEHLAQVAAELHESPADFERRGIDLEWHHQLDDPAIPYSPYLATGGAS